MSGEGGERPAKTSISRFEPAPGNGFLGTTKVAGSFYDGHGRRIALIGTDLGQRIANAFAHPQGGPEPQQEIERLTAELRESDEAITCGGRRGEACKSTDPCWEHVVWQRDAEIERLRAAPQGDARMREALMSERKVGGKGKAEAHMWAADWFRLQPEVEAFIQALIAAAFADPQRESEEIERVARGFGFPEPVKLGQSFSFAQFLTHVEYLQQERARLLFESLSPAPQGEERLRAERAEKKVAQAIEFLGDITITNYPINDRVAIEMILSDVRRLRAALAQEPRNE